MEEVPNLRGGLSTTTKWVMGFIVALAGFLGGPVVTLIRAPQADDFKELRRSVDEVHAQIGVINERDRGRDEREALERADVKEKFGELKELIKNRKGGGR